MYPNEEYWTEKNTSSVVHAVKLPVPCNSSDKLKRTLVNSIHSPIDLVDLAFVMNRYGVRLIVPFRSHVCPIVVLQGHSQPANELFTRQQMQLALFPITLNALDWKRFHDTYWDRSLILTFVPQI